MMIEKRKTPAEIESEAKKGLDRVRETLRSILAAHQVNQTEVEEGLGWGERYLSRLLHGHISIRFEHIFKIMAFLGRDPEYFYSKLCGHGENGISDRQRDVIVRDVVQRLLDIGKSA